MEWLSYLQTTMYLTINEYQREHPESIRTKRSDNENHQTQEYSNDYNDEFSPEEELLNIIRNKEPEEEKVKKIKKLFVGENKPDINFQDENNNTPLHIAVRRNQLQVVKLLKQYGAKIDIKNNRERSPLEVAKYLKRNNIVQILESDYSEIVSKPSNEEHNLELTTYEDAITKLKEFVKNFVLTFEHYLDQYIDRLENQISKSGKCVDLINRLVEGGKSGTEAIEIPKIKALSLLGINVFQTIIMAFGAGHNRKQLKKLIPLLYRFKGDSAGMRQELVMAGIEIFQCFEMHFVQITANKSWQRAIAKTAADIVSRVIDYSRENSENALSVLSVTKGAILGKSKKYKYTALNLPHIHRGHTIENKEFQSWNTAELFEKVGVVTIKSDGTPDRFYKKNNGRCDTAIYRYRLPFDWESEDVINQQYSLDKYQEGYYKYILKPKEKLHELSNTILKEINNEDPKLVENRLKETFQEAIQQIEEDAEENVKELEQFIDENFNELQIYINEHHSELRDSLQKIEQQNELHFQEANQQRQEITNSIKHTHEKLDKLSIAIEKKNQEMQSVWFNVPELTNLFTGRKSELEDLHHKIQTSARQVARISQVTAISGLGGIGKTELAKRYIEQYRDSYDKNILWINAETEATLIESFERLAKDKLGIMTMDTNNQKKNIQSIVEEVYNFFSSRKCLFVFNNVEKENYFYKFLPLRYALPGANKPYVLITSRIREWEKGISVIDLKTLELEEAMQFIKNGLDIDDNLQDEQIKKLAMELECLPLAIQQAIAYINDLQELEDYTVVDYLRDYKQKTKELLNSQVFQGMDNIYEKTTFTTWQITIDKIKSNKEYGQLALKILNAIAYFGHNNIDRELFLNFAENDENKLKSATRLLIKYSMINGELKQTLLNIHRLVQEVTRLKLQEEGEEMHILLEILELLKINLNEEIIDHAVSVWNHACKYEQLVTKFSNLPEGIITVLDNNFRYEEAYLFGERQLEILRNVQGTDHRDTLHFQSHLGVVLYKSGKYEETLIITEDAVNKIKRILGPDNIVTLTGMTNVGECLVKLGKFQEALECYEQVLEKKRNNPDVDTLDTLDTIDNIATVLYKLDQLEKALSFYEEVYDQRKQLLGDEHFKTLMAKVQIAQVHAEQGKIEKALEEIEETLSKIGPFQKDFLLQVLTMIEQMADMLYKQGKFDESLEHYEMVLHEKMSLLGNEHVEVFSTMNGIAAVLHNQGKYSEALQQYDKIIQNLKVKLGPYHPNTLTVASNMATALSELGDNDQAMKFYELIYSKEKEKLGLEHGNTLITESNMARVLRRQGKLDEALKFYTHCYDIRKKRFGIQHPITVATRNNLAQVLIDQGKNDEADEFLNKEEQSGAVSISPEECLPSTSQNRKRREADGCLITWEDIDNFNKEREKTREFSKIKIDSEQFISYLQNTELDEKRDQLIALAGRLEVDGKLKNALNAIINNKNAITYLNRAGRISSITMHGMMAKNLLADFLNGNDEGIAINVGFIGGGQAFSKVAEVVSMKGLKLVSEGKFLLGRSLKAASPFLARGTTAFVVYDLIKQIKAFQNGTEGALVGIVGDSIYLGVDVAEIGIEVAEIFQLFEGVSSITGPIAATIGAVIFVGTDIYSAVNRVNQIDKILHLTGKEKFVEGLRAFIGLKPENYIQEQMEEKQLNNQLVAQALKYLKQHNNIRNYIFPTGKLVENCHTIPHTTRICVSGGFGGCARARTVTFYNKKCTKKFQVDSESVVEVHKKQIGYKWRRTQPDKPNGGQIFCLPEGNYQPAPSYGAYLCKNAIGVSNLSADIQTSYALFSLGKGNDSARGFLDKSNIFLVNNGTKKYYGGNVEDIFIVEGSDIKGFIFGGKQPNTLDLTYFAPEQDSISIDVPSGKVKDYVQKNEFEVNGISKLLGRKKKADHIFISCEHNEYNPIYVDAQAGNGKESDYVTVKSQNCTYQMELFVRPYTVISNYANVGTFRYVVPRAEGTSQIIGQNLSQTSNFTNIFSFEYRPEEIQSIDVLNRSLSTISFHLSTSNSTSDLFNLTFSGINNISCYFSNTTQIKLGDQGNFYMLQQSNRSVSEVIKNCLTMANRIDKISFFIQLIPSNETIVIGNGNHEIIYNNPLCKSHLIGNGGENIYVIDTSIKLIEFEHLPLAEVIIYDLDTESSIDTIDLRNLVEKADDFSFQLTINKSANDLILKSTIIKQYQEQELLTLTLKDGLKWYNKTHIILKNVLMQIISHKNEWILKPLPLIFDKEKHIIIIRVEDVEANSELILLRKAGSYLFARDRGADLIITNAFNDIAFNDLYAIILRRFYEEPKMETLYIQFEDMTITLKDHLKEIKTTVTDINYIKSEYKNKIYNDIFKNNQTSFKNLIPMNPITNMYANQIEFKKPIKRNRRNDNMSSTASTFPGWINSFFSWLKKSLNNIFVPEQLHLEQTLNSGTGTSPSIVAIDVNSTIMLIDLFVRMYTGETYTIHSTMDKDMSSLDAQGYALNVIEEFEELLQDTAKENKIPIKELNIDFIKLQKLILQEFWKSTPNNIPNILILFVKEELSKSNFKDNDHFMAMFQEKLEILLNRIMKKRLDNKIHIFGGNDEKRYQNTDFNQVDQKNFRLEAIDQFGAEDLIKY